MKRKFAPPLSLSHSSMLQLIEKLPPNRVLKAIRLKQHFLILLLGVYNQVKMDEKAARIESSEIYAFTIRNPWILE